jgi:hypothetical protein
MSDKEPYPEDSYVFSEPIPRITAGATVGFIVCGVSYKFGHAHFNPGTTHNSIDGHVIAVPTLGLSFNHLNTHEHMEYTMAGGIIGAVAVAAVLGFSRANVRKPRK